MTDLFIDPDVTASVDHHAEHIAKDNLNAATRFVRAIDATCKFLRENPKVGRLWDSDHQELNAVRYWRVRKFPSYLIFYRFTNDCVHLLRLYHAKQDIAAYLDDELR